MTPSQSNVRLCLYVAIAMLTTAGAGIMGVDFHDGKQAAAYFIGILTQGAIMARGFIDRTAADVTPPDKQP